MRPSIWRVHAVLLALFALTGRAEYPVSASGQENTVPQILSDSNGLNTEVAPPDEFYGSGLNSDGLANTTIGKWGNRLSFRFRAPYTGALESIHLYLIPDQPDYAGGNGGLLLVELETDDDTPSHSPSGLRLASRLMSNLQAPPRSARYFPFVSLSPAVTLEAGAIYHLVLSNPDPQAQINFASVNALWMDTPLIPNNPTFADADLAVLLGNVNSSVWSPRRGYTPILQLDYADGTSAGWGYMEVWSGNPKLISGDSAVRETFTVTGSDRPVSSVSVRVARVSGSQDLIVRLEQGDGAVIEEGTIPAESMPVADSSSLAGYTWVTYNFEELPTLASGQSYNLVLTAPADSAYQAFPVRKGASYGFKDTTFFSDGYAQFTTGSGWEGWDQWGERDRKEGDLQFYFTVVR